MSTDRDRLLLRLRAAREVLPRGRRTFQDAEDRRREVPTERAQLFAFLRLLHPEIGLKRALRMVNEAFPPNKYCYDGLVQKKKNRKAPPA